MSLAVSTTSRRVRGDDDERIQSLKKANPYSAVNTLGVLSSVFDYKKDLLSVDPARLLFFKIFKYCIFNYIDKFLHRK